MSFVCARNPPATDLIITPDFFGSANPPVIKILRFFLLERIFFASSLIDGAMITSVNISEISFAVSPSNFWFNAIIPPKADTESHLNAF